MAYVTIVDEGSFTKAAKDSINNAFNAGYTAGSLTVSTTSTLTGAVSAGSTLAVTGATTLSSTLAVTGATTLTGVTSVLLGAQSLSLTAITANGAIDPHTAANYIITKAGVAAMTLAAPTATTDDGKLLYVISGTANAHTVTATGLYLSGTASVNLATFAAVAGASMLLMAYNAKWVVVYVNAGVTLS